MSSRTNPPWSLVALFTAGYLAAYLLPTTVDRLSSGLALSATEAGSIGSALLLSSAGAGFLLAAHVHRIGPRRLARAGLLLAAVGHGTAALCDSLPVVVAGAVVGGFGSGTVTTVAATGIAAMGAPRARTESRAWASDPHRASTLGLLSVSALAGAVYLTVPHLGPGHGLPLAAIALTALLVWPAAGRLTSPAPTATAPRGTGRLPHPRSGLVLAAGILCWSLAQNSLWGVSGRIGLAQAHLTEVTVGVVFAIALGAGLLGVIGAGMLGPRLGSAVPIGAGTALIAACIALSARATGLGTFATGEIAWNILYPIVLSYLIGLAASLDQRGRWAVLVGSASSLGTAAGPLIGSVLSARAGFPAMGAILATGLFAITLPLTAVALHTGGRPLLPGVVRRRGGTPAAVVAAATGTPAGSVPTVGAPEQPVVEIPLGTPASPVRQAYSTAGPRQATAAPGSGNR
ncbi:MFS transporter [Streptomyces hygroscopicus]|uniref:MFS transporter n=1 Tax=Streptomyces hygroscopicus TaxID=1912 RepID=UPI00224011BB|nr:MFS transporter [Streptomyces hygroscopicus]MCW7943584.1 MFS transporter [Streptomyces hygroscopicus]